MTLNPIYHCFIADNHEGLSHKPRYNCLTVSLNKMLPLYFYLHVLHLEYYILFANISRTNDGRKEHTTRYLGIISVAAYVL